MKRNIKALVYIAVFLFVLTGNHMISFAQGNRDRKDTAFELEGSGTPEIPYKINSEDDFCTFRDLVNEGISFENKYIEQMVDIDLSSVGNWEPIGVFDSGNYFKGTYDGKGHTISNLTIDADGNVGLFGALGGTVLNLGIESGLIKGSCTGSIASHTAFQTAPRIINCYNKAAVCGLARAGGIADNFTGGIIYACWNEGTVEGPVSDGICSYTADSVTSSFSIYDTDYSECISLLNRGLFDAEMFIDKNFQTLNAYDSEASLGVSHKPTAVNETLPFEGEGSQEIPYLIEDADDLIKLREAVSSGMRLNSKYFLQTADLSMSEAGNWTPIGSMDQYTVFEGVYDGNGHVISDVLCTEHKQSALFGVLNGTVVNLGIESGTFSGEEAASVAANLLEDGMIVNCYSQSNVSGKTSGGLCLQNNGRIICSAGLNTIENIVSGGGIAYTGHGSAEYCWSNSKIVNDSFTGFLWENKRFQNLSSVIKEWNRNLAEVSCQQELRDLSLIKLSYINERLEYSGHRIHLMDALLANIYVSRFYLLLSGTICLILLCLFRAAKKRNCSFHIKSDYVYLFFLILASLVFNLLFVNRTMNHIVGWQQFCARLFDEGKVPYRDYYYYLPPFYLLLARGIIKLTGGKFLLYRLYGIFERIIIHILIFYILKRYFKTQYAWLGSFIGEIVTCTSVFDGYGDYNQTRKLILMLNIYFFIRFFETLQNEKKARLWMAMSGITLGLGVTCVQTGLAIAATFFIILIWYCFTCKANILYCLEFFITAAIPIAAASFLLHINHALSGFYEQIFTNGNSKGSVDSLLVTFFQYIIKPESFVLSLVIVFAYILIQRKNQLKAGKLYKGAAVICAIIIAHCLYNMYFPYLGGLIQTTGKLMEIQFAIEGILLSIIALFVWTLRKSEQSTGLFEHFIICCLILTGLYICINIDTEVSVRWYSNTGFLAAKNVLRHVMFYLSLFFICCEFIHLLIKKETAFPIGCLIYVSASAVLQFISFIGSGTKDFSLPGAMLWWSLGVCLLCTFCMEHCKKLYIPCVFLLVLISGLSAAQRISVPYNWYGWVDAPLSEEDYYRIDLAGMEGFRVNKKTKVTLEQVTKLIKKNSDRNDFIFSFPHIKLYNILSARMRMDTFVPCYWFDVCSDAYADIDAELLKTLAPDILVLCDVGEDAWKIHENLFRGGNLSSQRKIQEWYNERISSEEYVQIGQVYNVSVYKLNDGSPVRYTYFDSGNDDPARASEVRYGKMTASFLELFELKGWAKCLFYFLLMTAALFLLKCNKELWKRTLIILLAGNLILNIHPVYYLAYSLIPLLLFSQGRITREALAYMAVSICICLAAIFGYSSEWLSIKYFIIFLSLGIFIYLIAEKTIKSIAHRLLWRR